MRGIVVAELDGIRGHFYRLRRAAMGAVASIALMGWAGGTALAAQMDVNIPPQGIESALKALAKQADIQLVYSSKAVGNLVTQGVSGLYTPQEAMQILLRDSGLEFEFTAHDMVAVGHKQTQRAPYGPAAPAKVIRMAQAGATTGTTTEADEEDKEGAVEEIIVTAQKREARLQDTPITMTVFTDDILRTSDIETLDDLQFFTPNLTLQNEIFAITFIRGVGSGAFGVGVDPSSTSHVDGVYIPRTSSAYSSFWDLERVEILKGPQGTLFGRNTTGGVINYISKLPTSSFEAAGGVTLRSTNGKKRATVVGMVALPPSNVVRRE